MNIKNVIKIGIFVLIVSVMFWFDTVKVYGADSGIFGIFAFSSIMFGLGIIFGGSLAAPRVTDSKPARKTHNSPAPPQQRLQTRRHQQAQRRLQAPLRRTAPQPRSRGRRDPFQ